MSDGPCVDIGLNRKSKWSTIFSDKRREPLLKVLRYGGCIMYIDCEVCFEHGINHGK